MSQNEVLVSTTVESPKIRHITPPLEELQSLPSAFYNCNICGLQVKTQSNLRAHYIKTHGLVNDAKDVAFLLRKKTDISDVFHCPVSNCKYTKSSGTGFSKFWHLKQHYQLVHMKKTFQCATCSQRFSTPSAQAYHSKTCGTNFECPICGRKYKAKKFLNQHSRRSGHDVRSRPELRSSPQHHTSLGVEIGSSQVSIPSTSSSSSDIPSTSSNPSTRVAILPLLILPLGVSPGTGLNQNNSVSYSNATASLIGEVISQLGSNLTVLPPLVSAGSGGYANTPMSTQPSTQLSNLQYAPDTTQSSEYGQPESVNVGTEGGERFFPLVDVGTATMRLSHAHTQTELNVPPDYIPSPFSVPAAQQTNFCYYGDEQHQVQMTRDSFTVTSPPHVSVGNSPQPSTFLPDMSHTSTYMSPGNSIELQYPEVNSNGTMTNYHGAHPHHLQQHAFQQTATMPTTTTSVASNGVNSALYLHSGSTTLPSCYGEYNSGKRLDFL
ncbi:unnamed protein product [Rodentolepis nana]|uniref:C2H2-type domain-containing protein n=1 Tax=Rodentolepis nana TaxID=102285 RepID=A0A0R3T7D5_RODNA|nr:unnamed protein product [Rodentolepis nana]